MTISSKQLFQALLFLALGLSLVAATCQMDLTASTGINDKIAHLATFLVLGLLAHRAYPRFADSWHLYLWLLAYGLGIEVIQYLLPYRSFSLLDLAADAVGLLLSHLLMLTIRQAARARL